MWNPREQQHHHVEEQEQDQDEDDSWEVRAFAEDTNNIMGTTWPPRSYSCTFCRREFRSAQALGGHMNVHRRDRARLHHHHQLASPHSHNHSISSFSNHTPSFLNISHHEPNFVANGGLCLLYPFPNPNNNNNASFSPLSSLPHNNNACGDSPSTVFSVSSSSSHDSLQCPPIMVPPSCSATSFDYFSAPAERNNNVFSSCSEKVQEPATTSSSSTHEELDLELRLGNRSTSSS